MDKRAVKWTPESTPVLEDLHVGRTCLSRYEARASRPARIRPPPRTTIARRRNGKGRLAEVRTIRENGPFEYTSKQNHELSQSSSRSVRWEHGKL
ncbi:hypothetical protein KIN20_009890 [Parelaphostrongylus tenuis]|uniref:Uncharacterized protein n=1 Tax=Parelaphostrongylus tenuis TaxID=148309 RepID=A0AAD5QNP6_PARTN|nr:hypothetical protein KIN20_009890 [Parelaphostrongylus tenuis]